MAIAAKHLLRGIKTIGSGGGAAAVIPVGVVAIWSGVLASIPANWSLCDGTVGTPNLIAKFIRGSAAGVDPGATGGADSHTHASMTSMGGHSHTLASLTHNHTVNSAGDHVHGLVAQTFTGSVPAFMGVSAGSHQHTTNTANHSHSTDSQGAHTHSISSDDGRPPFYEVAYIQAKAGAAVAANLILIWAGTLLSIPAGWSLCDGGGSRPDLRTKFIRGVNTNVTNPGTTGGATTHGHTEGNCASHSHASTNATAHSHTFNAYTWTHSHNINMLLTTTGGWPMQTDTHAGDHTHNASDTIDTHNHDALGNGGVHSHGVNTSPSLPAYYDVAFIFNDGGATAVPSGGIAIWTGLLVNIPAGYSLCDGFGGRPDLRAKFIRGSATGVDPGGTGGSNTHTHTEIAAGSHTDHSQTSAGSHQHAATNTTGGHTHTSSAIVIGGLVTNAQTNNTAGDHSHSYNNEGAHNNHTVSDPGTHNHQPWSTDDGRPAYYEVAFIIKA